MKYINKLVALIASLALLIGCSEPDYPNAQPSINVRYARILFINASPDAPSLVYQVNNFQAAALAPQYASGYVNVNPGSEQIRVKKAVFAPVGTDTLAQKGDLLCKDSKNAPTLTTLAGGGSYTVIVTDTVNRPHAKKSLFSTDQGGLLMLNNGPISDNLAIPSSSAGVRFYNLAPGSPAVYLSNNANSMGSLSNSKAYKAMTNSFTNITPGAYTLQVTANSISDPTILATQNIVLAPGKAYTIFLTAKIVSINATPVTKVPYALNVVQHN